MTAAHHERPEGLPPAGLCECDHRIYTHGRRTVPNTGTWEYTGCHVAGCRCTKFRPQDGTNWPHP